MKHILLITYSQTGQTNDIANRLLKAFQVDETCSIHHEIIKPSQDYPFPWSGREFFDAMPETVNEVPMELEHVHIPDKKWDLILLGYQPWFLSVCRPIMSFLQTEKAATLFAHTPVVTFLGCRNMFVNAQEKMKRQLNRLQAKHVGQIALTDKSGNLVSLVTILAWMLKGVREGYLGIFPRSGVSLQDLETAELYGEMIHRHMQENTFSALQDELVSAHAVEIKPNLLLMEDRGAKNFSIWANFISAKGGPGNPKRFGRLRLFSILLPTAIVILSPIMTLLKWIITTLKRKQLRKDAEYFKSVAYRGYNK